MSKKETTSALVEGILRLAAGGVFIGGSLLIPNLAIALDKPFMALMKNLDNRARERETNRVLNYMKREGLIASQKYVHGINITQKGKLRLQKTEFKNLIINKPPTWDGKWRLVIFDIPEGNKFGRDSLTIKLKQLGFHLLQRSVWIHPFPCHEVIEAIALNYKITKFITYIETSYIDKPELLENRFKSMLN